MLIKKDAVKSLLRTGAGAGAYNIKEEDIADGRKTAACLTQSKEGRTAMSKLVNMMCPLCRIYDVHFRNSMEKHRLGITEILSGNVDFVLEDPP